MRDDEIKALPPYSNSLGLAFKRWRLLKGIKQTHAADLIGVGQSTISRWERGELTLDQTHHLVVMDMLSARLTSAQDAALAMLVTHSAKPMHLICDVSHTLLAFSQRRGREFGVNAAELLGHSLWKYATDEIVTAETRIRHEGWAEEHGSLRFFTGANESAAVPIHDSTCTWTRFTLSNGTCARLVETDADA
ncbi:helix-turn-helix domain-containing protein [Pseudomonas monteilii]